MTLDTHTIAVGDRLIAFHDAEGNLTEHLHIKFHQDHATGFVSLILSMRQAAIAHGEKYRVGVDHNTLVALEALATTVELALNVNEDDIPTDMFGDVVAFHEKFDLAYHGKPRSLDGVLDDVGANLYDFRVKFNKEESDEYVEEQPALNDAINTQDLDGIVEGLHKQLDALLDSVYVQLGTAYLQFGPRIVKEAWKRIQRANMAKKRAETVEESKRGSLFDVVKPAGWEEPDHRDLVKDNAHVTYRQPGQLNAGYESDTKAAQ